MRLVRLAPIGALALTTAACGTLRPASVSGGECHVFERPEYVVMGKTRYDQNWIDSNTEAGVAACGWQRPKPRPEALGRPPALNHLPARKKKRSDLAGRISRAVSPNSNTQSSAPAPIPASEPPSVPTAPAAPRDPVDELLEPGDALPPAPSGRRCWWC